MRSAWIKIPYCTLQTTILTESFDWLSIISLPNSYFILNFSQSMSTVKVVRGARILTADLYGEPRPKAARPPRFIFSGFLMLCWLYYYSGILNCQWYTHLTRFSFQESILQVSRARVRIRTCPMESDRTAPLPPSWIQVRTRIHFSNGCSLFPTCPESNIGCWRVAKFCIFSQESIDLEECEQRKTRRNKNWLKVTGFKIADALFMIHAILVTKEYSLQKRLVALDAPFEPYIDDDGNEIMGEEDENRDEVRLY